MRRGHGGTISRLCACRRDHSDVRRPHRERARHRGGAAAAVVARRATEWHAFAVPALPRGPSYSFWAFGSARRTPSDHSAHSSWPAAWWWTVSGPSRASTPATVLPSVDATREHVPPVLHAVELPISRKRSDHRAAVEALVRRHVTLSRARLESTLVDPYLDVVHLAVAFGWGEADEVLTVQLVGDSSER